jgi:hypothetical protein
VQVIARAYGKISLVNVELVEIERKIYTGNGRSVPYYMIHVKGGFVSADPDGFARLYPCTAMNARVSDKVFNRSNARVGSKVCFKGDIEEDPMNGIHLKNVLKIETSPAEIHPEYIASDDHVQGILAGRISLLTHQSGYQFYERDFDRDDDDDGDDNDDEPVNRRLYPRSYQRPYYPRPATRARAKTEKMGNESIFELIDQKSDGGKTFRKIERALVMLGNQRNLLMIKSQKDSLMAVVKSQTTDGIEYATYISETGRYFCCPQDLEYCLGMKGSLCKHIILSLAAACKDGTVPKDTLKKWIQNTQGKHPIIDENMAAGLFVESKMPKDARIGWREIEILPEDMMAF